MAGSSDLEYGLESWSRDGIRALKTCPARSEGRRLGKDASPEGLIPSFRTRVVAEPAL